MEALLQDLRLALRQLAKSPGFTAVAVLTLALGIGANTAIFSAVDAVLLRPLPYPQSDRLVDLSAQNTEPVRFAISYPDLLDFRALTHDFTGVAGYSSQLYNLTGAGDPREVQAAFVTANLFDVLGVHPTIGHSFTPQQENDPVALVSYALWAQSFGRDPAILGKAIALDGKSYTVIGVMPPAFRFPTDGIEVWTPIGGIRAVEPQALTMRDLHVLNGVARMAAGVALARAQGDLDVLANRLQAEQANDTSSRRIIAIGPGPGPGGGGGGGGGGPRISSSPSDAIQFNAVLLRDAAIGDVSGRLWVLLGAVGIVLLIACANAANLLLARAATRGREMAIRRALGAGRGRLIRQLLTESVVLALVGAGLGLVVSKWGLDALLALWPRALPRSQEVGLHLGVLGFTAVLALVTGIAFGLAPALRATAVRIEEGLRQDSAGSTGGRRQRVQHTLVVIEMALALVLLVGAGLLARSFAALNAVSPGFDTRDVLAGRIRLTPSRYPTPPQQKMFFETVQSALAGRPDVSGVALSETMPLSGGIRVVAFDPHPVRPDYPEPYFAAFESVVAPEYFSTMRIPIRRGRGFGPEDRVGAPAVAVVSARFASALWPNQDPIGKQFPFRGPREPGRPVTVIGVVDDLRSASLEQPNPLPTLYLSSLQEAGQPEMWVVMRSSRSAPLALIGALKDAVKLTDPEQPIGDLVSLEQLIGRQTAARRFNTTLLGIFALLAVGLALVGIYGVTSYAVAQRQRELGIRLALGAGPKDVMRLLVGESLMRVAIGVVLGLAIALVASQALVSMLYGVQRWDPATFAGTALLLGVVALLATWLPARKATRVDPIVTLRAE
jgi:putative ABC transport system permease protein